MEIQLNFVCLKISINLELKDKFKDKNKAKPQDENQYLISRKLQERYHFKLLPFSI